MSGVLLLRFLLDTNIIIALFAADGAVLQQLSLAQAVYLPSIVLGELYYGARKSAQSERNIKRVDELAAANTILNCDINTARHYGEIKDRLRAKGKPLPENDIWIAAIAQQYDLVLVTRDAHFQEVDGLALTTW